MCTLTAKKDDKGVLCWPCRISCRIGPCRLRSADTATKLATKFHHRRRGIKAAGTHVVVCSQSSKSPTILRQCDSFFWALDCDDLVFRTLHRHHHHPGLFVDAVPLWRSVLCSVLTSIVFTSEWWFRDNSDTRICACLLYLYRICRGCSSVRAF